MSFPHPNPRKNTPQNRHCKRVTTNLKKTTRRIKIDSQGDPKIHQKSMKIQPWIPRCPLRCPCGPMDHQDGDPRAKIKPPRYQNGASRSPKLQFRIKQIANPSSTQVRWQPNWLPLLFGTFPRPKSSGNQIGCHSSWIGGPINLSKGGPAAGAKP